MAGPPRAPCPPPTAYAGGDPRRTGRRRPWGRAPRTSGAAAGPLRQQAARAPGVEHRGQAPTLEGAALGQALGRDAVARAQPQDQPFGEGLARGQHLVALERQAPALYERAVALHRLHVAVPHVPEEAAGSRPHGQVLLPSPVALVVARA